MLIDRPVELGPLAGDLQVGLIDEPPVARSVPTGPGSFDELWGETLQAHSPDQSPAAAICQRNSAGLSVTRARCGLTGSCWALRSTG